MVYVIITEISTERFINKVYVELTDISNAAVSDGWFFDEAWQSSVEDRLVDEGAREKYNFTLSQT
jgi:hypothetical protein